MFMSHLGKTLISYKLSVGCAVQLNVGETQTLSEDHPSCNSIPAMRTAKTAKGRLSRRNAPKRYVDALDMQPAVQGQASQVLGKSTTGGRPALRHPSCSHLQGRNADNNPSYGQIMQS